MPVGLIKCNDEHEPKGAKGSSLMGMASRFGISITLCSFLLGCTYLPLPGSTHEGRLAQAEYYAPKRIIVNIEPFTSIDDAIRARPSIAWESDSRRAQACTLAFAAKEIQSQLDQVGVRIQILPRVPSQHLDRHTTRTILLATSGDPAIAPLLSPALRAMPFTSAESFAVVRNDNNYYILGNSRTGALYGSYHFLNLLGFAWDDPNQALLPDRNAIDFHKVPNLASPWNPTVRLRGFWTYGQGVTVSNEFALWMARNRFNLIGRTDPSLAHMLGIKQWGGGHNLLQEVFSDPRLFQDHPTWFGVHAGSRQPISMTTASYFNPCFANPEVGDYFSKVIIDRLAHGDLSDVDVLAVWPSDARTSYYFDESPEAKALGNQTDNLLYFYNIVSKNLQQARTSGMLNRPVTLSGISYFTTWTPPTRLDIVQALAPRDYIHLFYPIYRSFSGPVDSQLDKRTGNRRMMEYLREWKTLNGLSMGMVEYYNASHYGGLTINESETFQDDYSTLMKGSTGLFAYMHPVRSGAGPRCLLHALMSAYTWNGDGSGQAPPPPAAQQDKMGTIKSHYFSRRFGKGAKQWQTIYQLMSNSLGNAEEIFADNSLDWCLFQASYWAHPPYSPDEIATFIPRYLDGGDQWLPARWSGEPLVESVFPGLKKSIELQASAKAAWDQALSASGPGPERSGMEQDIAWFELTRQRYLLMQDCSTLFLARRHGQADLALKALGRIRDEEAFLRRSPLLTSTISPVNQLAFLDRVDRFIASP